MSCCGGTPSDDVVHSQEPSQLQSNEMARILSAMNEMKGELLTQIQEMKVLCEITRCQCGPEAKAGGEGYSSLDQVKLDELKEMIEKSKCHCVPEGKTGES